MTEQIFAVEGLHCGGCVNTVRTALLAVPGVSAVDVTLGDGAPSTVRVEADRELASDVVVASLSDRGEFRLVD